MPDKQDALRHLTDDDIMQVYDESTLYHAAMHEEADQEEAKKSLIMFTRDIIEAARKKV